MKNEKTLGEKSTALRDEFLNITKRPSKEEIKDLHEFEFISGTRQEEEISPILKMNEEQVLDFVEAFDVSMLSKLTVKELNYIGEVLGVEPSILLGSNEEE